MSNEIRNKNGIRLPVIALGVSLAALALLAASGFGTRLGMWQFRTGFAVLKWASFMGIATALFAAVVGALCLRVRNLAGAAVALVALLCGLAAFGLPFSWKLKAQQYPRIHDISTDLSNPPEFQVVAPLPPHYPGAAVAAQQLKGYPDLKTLVLDVPMQDAFKAALLAARDMGWQIVTEAPAEGRIEATDTTFWFGFKDDIVIRIYPAGGRSLVDIRSVSRVGISDVGTNAKRIRTFLAKISHRP